MAVLGYHIILPGSYFNKVNDFLFAKERLYTIILPRKFNNYEK